MNSLHTNNRKSKFARLDRDKVIQATAAVRHNNGTETYWMGRCPTHHDKTPSCKIFGERYDAKVHCFAGCSFEKIRDALLARGCAVFDSDDLHETYNPRRGMPIKKWPRLMIGFSSRRFQTMPRPRT